MIYFDSIVHRGTTHRKMTEVIFLFCFFVVVVVVCLFVCFILYFPLSTDPEHLLE